MVRFCKEPAGSLEPPSVDARKTQHRQTHAEAFDSGVEAAKVRKKPSRGRRVPAAFAALFSPSQDAAVCSECGSDVTITLFAATESDGLGHTLIIGSTGRGKVTDEYWKAFALTEDEFMLVRRAGHPGGQ